MIETCPRCAKCSLRPSERALTRRIGDRTISTAIVIYRCDTCDWSPFPIESWLENERDIATCAALFGPVTSETFEIMRRSLGLDVADAARAAGLSIDALMRVVHGGSPSIEAWLALAWRVRERAADAAPPGPGLASTVLRASSMRTAFDSGDDDRRKRYV